MKSPEGPRSTWGRGRMLRLSPPTPASLQAPAVKTTQAENTAESVPVPEASGSSPVPESLRRFPAAPE